MEIKLSSLLDKQRELDALINAEHHVTHESTKSERFLALLVEIGELANASRAFKYWSLKPSEERPILLDEYADGLHFFLSLALVYNFAVDSVTYEEISPSKTNIVHSVLNVYEKIIDFKKSESAASYFLALQAFLTLGSALQFAPDEIKNGYGVKLLENYKRQDSKY